MTAFQEDNRICTNCGQIRDVHTHVLWDKGGSNDVCPLTGEQAQAAANGDRGPFTRTVFDDSGREGPQHWTGF